MPDEEETRYVADGSLRGRFMEQLAANLAELRAAGRSLSHLYENVDYQVYWTGMEWLSVDHLEHTVVQQLLPSGGSRLADMGCGYGRLADCYMDCFENTVLLDSSVSLLAQAAEKTCGRGACVVADLSRLPFRGGSFDTVLMVRVLHHVEDCTGCLRELNRVLSNNGCLIFNYRNKRDALHMIRWLRGRNAYNPFNSEPIEESLMLTAHHPQFVERAICDAGFRTERSVGTTGALLRLLAKVGCGGLGLALSARLAPFFGRTKLTPWIFLRARVVVGTSEKN